jgi:hypothetical protein
MAPGPYETHVYSLQSAFGVSRSHQSGVDLQENSLGLGPGTLGQSCFALEGSSAAARTLRRRHSSNAVPWNQGVVLGRSGVIRQQQQEQSTVHMATPTLDISRGSGGTTYMSVDVCDGTAAPGYEDSYNYRYAGNISSVLILIGILILPSSVRQIGGSGVPPLVPRTRVQSSYPATPSSIDSPFTATPNSSYFSHASPMIESESSLRSPSLTGWRPTSWDDIGHESEAHGLSPLLFPIPLGGTIRPCDDDVVAPEDLGIARQRKPKVQRKASLLSIIRSLQDRKFTAIDLLVSVIDGQGEFEGFRNALFSPANRDALTGLFDKFYQDDKGRKIVADWMFPHAVTLVQEKIHAEMEAAKPHLRMHTNEVTPAFIEQWDIHQIMEPVIHAVTPTLTHIIVSAGESKASKAKSKPESTKSKNRATVGSTVAVLSVCVHGTDSTYMRSVMVRRHLSSWCSYIICVLCTRRRSPLVSVFRLGRPEHHGR